MQNCGDRDKGGLDAPSTTPPFHSLDLPRCSVGHRVRHAGSRNLTAGDLRYVTIWVTIENCDQLRRQDVTAVVTGRHR